MSGDMFQCPYCGYTGEVSEFLEESPEEPVCPECGEDLAMDFILPEPEGEINI